MEVELVRMPTSTSMFFRALCLKDSQGTLDPKTLNLQNPSPSFLQEPAFFLSGKPGYTNSRHFQKSRPPIRFSGFRFRSVINTGTDPCSSVCLLARASWTNLLNMVSSFRPFSERVPELVNVSPHLYSLQNPSGKRS